MRSGDFQRLFPQNSKMESFFLFFDFWGFFLAKWSGLGSSESLMGMTTLLTDVAGNTPFLTDKRNLYSF